MTHDSYKLDPLDFEVEEVTIQHILLQSDSNVNYLAIHILYYSGMIHSYPSVALKDVEDGKNEVLNFLDIESFKEAKGNKIYAVTNTVNNNIFALYNEKNNKFFCLQAKYFPEAYNQSLDKMVKDANLSVSHLTPSEALLYSFLYCLPTKDSISSKLHNIASSAILYKKLDSSIEHKNEINSKKLKI